MSGQKPGFRGTVEERFWSKVQKTEKCWLWTASTYRNGYGQFKPAHTRLVGAHRFSYELHFGPIPDGMKVCHTCDNRRCVRPEHFFLGTTRDNNIDRAQKTSSCANGHPYTQGPVGASRPRCEVCAFARAARHTANRTARRRASRTSPIHGATAR